MEHFPAAKTDTFSKERDNNGRKGLETEDAVSMLLS